MVLDKKTCRIFLDDVEDDDGGEQSTLSEGCPKCDGVIREGKNTYRCQERDYSFRRTVASRKMSAAEAEQLLAKGRAGPFDDFKTKKGTPFTATMVLDMETGEIYLDFEVDGKADNDGEQATLSECCPKCSGVIKVGKEKFQCQNCDFSIWRTVANREMSSSETEQLLADGRAGPFDGFEIEYDTLSPATMVLDRDTGKVKLEYEKGVEVGKGWNPVILSERCPKCQGVMKVCTRKFRCQGQGCKFRFKRKKASREISVDEANQLLATGRAGPFDGFKKQEGVYSRATMVLDRKTGEISLEWE